MTGLSKNQEGSLLRQIGVFCLPYLCSIFLQTLYGMADLFIIGQFEGPGSITAVSIGSQVMNMVTVMIVGLAMGTTVHIGHSIGAGRRDLAARFTGNTLTLFMGGSLVLAALLVGLVNHVVGWMVRRYDLGIPLKRADLKPRWDIIRQILRVGVPISMQDGFIQISFLIITVIANERGVVDAAAVGIVEKFISFVFMVPSSMLATVSALGAISIGAGNPRKAIDILHMGLRIVVTYGVVIALGVQLCAYGVVSLFTGDGAVIAAGGPYLKGYIFDTIFAGIHFCFSGYFTANGRSEISFLHNITSIVCARVPLAYLASKAYPDTLFPMGLATVSGSLVSVGICLVAYRILKPRFLGRVDDPPAEGA